MLGEALIVSIIERKSNNMEKQKDNKVAIVGVIVLTVMLLLGVIINRERDAQFEQYALANDCEWVWQGTSYGDDRDFVCR